MVYDPAFSNRLPEWLANLISTTGLANATETLQARIPQVPGNLPNVFEYYLNIMSAVRGVTASGEIGRMAIGISHIGETF